MKQNKLAANIIFSIILQITNLIAPLITAPYIARVLNPELIGDYSYALANTSYFVLFECLGFTLYGTIKIASYRDDEEKRSKIFWEISILRFALMILTLVVFLVVFVYPQNDYNKKIYAIMIIYIVASGIDVSWFLNGIEEFKVIAIRNILVKIFNVLFILVLVKGEEDFFSYVFIMQFFVLLGYLACYPSVIKYIKRPDFREIKLRSHIVPSLVYFIPGLTNTIFSSADKTVLGIVSSNLEVGMYEQANKICQLLIAIISAISNVVLPRITYLYHNAKDTEKINDITKQSIRAVVTICVPMVFGMILISDTFIPFFFGEGYERSVNILKVLSVNVLFVSLCNFWGQQGLIARDKQKEYNISIVSSAIINVLLNLLLVGKYEAIGVSIASVVASIFGFLIMINFTKKESLNCVDFLVLSKNSIISSIIMFLLCARIEFMNNLTTLIVRVLVAIISYAICLLLFHDDTLYSFIKKHKENHSG